jgi:hypothetical protein
LRRATFTISARNPFGIFRWAWIGLGKLATVAPDHQPNVSRYDTFRKTATEFATGLAGIDQNDMGQPFQPAFLSTSSLASGCAKVTDRREIKKGWFAVPIFSVILAAPNRLAFPWPEKDLTKVKKLPPPLSTSLSRA